MQSDSNVNPISPESNFINEFNLKKAKDVIRNSPKGARYWVKTTGYHNDLPDFSQYKFQHIYDLSILKNVIDEYELSHGVDFGIPKYLLCDPRTYTLKSDSKFDDIIGFKINIIIKCTDEHISQVFNSWWGNDLTSNASTYFKLYKNNNLGFFLNIIAWLASDFCIERIDDWNDMERLQNHVLNRGVLVGFLDCFEIESVEFEWYLNYDHFEIVAMENQPNEKK